MGSERREGRGRMGFWRGEDGRGRASGAEKMGFERRVRRKRSPGRGLVEAGGA